MVDMVAHFRQLRQKLNWTTDEDFDKFLSAVLHTFTDIVQVCLFQLEVFFVWFLSAVTDSHYLAS